MNNFSKKFINEEGKEETIVANSSDQYNLKLTDKYSIANKGEKSDSLFVKRFKKSIFGSDIGIKSKGFSNIAILSVVIVLFALIVMYFIWRF